VTKTGAVLHEGVEDDCRTGSKINANPNVVNIAKGTTIERAEKMAGQEFMIIVLMGC